MSSDYIQRLFDCTDNEINCEFQRALGVNREFKYVIHLIPQCKTIQDIMELYRTKMLVVEKWNKYLISHGWEPKIIIESGKLTLACDFD